MKHGRISRDDLARVDSPRPSRKPPHRPAPDLPVHYGGFTEPAPCGLPVGAWAARTNRPDLVTCLGCRQLRRVVLAADPGSPRPPSAAVIPAIRVLAAAAHLTP